ncbi:DNA cytosine methyltransferase [Cupriavidus sp. D39]|uniref:DNA cytosine methyltransferase n=1 Tax=Cupriavidus sp. D39 TaxID=2997877 RepID=UPI0022712798|nr:DNA cytosine methyltransferase [Cupriavidus sp. D39]MCY0856856.1 DNA cytosine methyltransferase [Cupriavidus sp. D39]
MKHKFSFYEFFAGGGMARAGLGNAWECLFANDLDPVKASAYAENWGKDHFDGRDISKVAVSDLGGEVDLAWASFPCQDLSVAGNGLGIGNADARASTRSGALWPCLELIEKLRQQGRQPPLVVLENVAGLLTLDGGRDFAAICTRLGKLGYRYGAIIVDAKHFVPQSRPRVFIVAVRRDMHVPRHLDNGMATANWHTPPLLRAFASLGAKAHKDWIWWDLGIAPKLPKNALIKSIDRRRAAWNTPEETERLIGMMAPNHLARLEQAKHAGSAQIGSLYLRMRREGEVNKQRVEIAFDPTLGCLRTPRGGASRPRIILVDGNHVRTRLLSIEEAARLMGLDADYALPDVYHHAFKIIGDGVVVPVVRFLAERLLEPLALTARREALQDKICVA